MLLGNKTMIDVVKTVYWTVKIYAHACVSYYHMRKEDKEAKRNISKNKGITLAP